MSGLGSVTIVICASALICSLVQNLVSDKAGKKIISLVLGAFIVCSAVLPIKNAVASIDLSFADTQSGEDGSEASTDDEAYGSAVIAQAEGNLEAALSDILLQNGIEISSCEIILSKTDDESIIIASISIYIDRELKYREAEISSLVGENFQITPSINYISDSE